MVNKFFLLNFSWKYFDNLVKEQKKINHILLFAQGLL